MAVNRELSDVEKVMRINPHALRATGELKSLKEQWAAYSYALFMGNEKAGQEYLPLVVAMNASVYGVDELANKPVVLTGEGMRHVRRKHGASIEDLENLATELAENLLVFQDPQYESHYVFVLQSKSENGNRLISILEAEAHANSVNVNKVVSVHGKRNMAERLLVALERGCGVYPNERTGSWLSEAKEWEPVNSDRISLTEITRQSLSALYCIAFPEQAASEGFFNEPSVIRQLWKQLEKVPFTEREDGTQVLPEKWLGFEAGSTQEEVHAWFDERCEGGVHALQQQSVGTEEEKAAVAKVLDVIPGTVTDALNQEKAQADRPQQRPGSPIQGKSNEIRK